MHVHPGPARADSCSRARWGTVLGARGGGDRALGGNGRDGGDGGVLSHLMCYIMQGGEEIEMLWNSTAAASGGLPG